MLVTMRPNRVPAAVRTDNGVRIALSRSAAAAQSRIDHDWPHRDASRIVVTGRRRWHVQVMGAGPALLLLHGTGASTHSWRALMPRLARRHTVIAPDLPGHAFTDPLEPDQMSLPGVATAVRELLDTMGIAPVAGVGHSAGAAILARLRLDGYAPLRAMVSINGALLPFRGVAAWLFPPVARLLALTTWVPSMLAARATDPRAVQRLIDSTGSTLDAEGIGYYARLVRSPSHVAGVLAMMARWDLGALERDLARLDVPLALIVGETDRTVSPSEARILQQRLPEADVVSLPGLGHLAHEDAPERIARFVLGFLRRHGLDD